MEIIGDRPGSTAGTTATGAATAGARSARPADGPPSRRAPPCCPRRPRDRHRDLHAADQRNNRRLLVEAAAREPEVRGVGRKLVERGIDRQPEPARRAFVDVDLRPRVVVERAADVRQAHGNARRYPDGPRHGDKQRRVLVAVANARSQHLSRRGQADGRLLLHGRIHEARQRLGARARADRAADRLYCRGANVRIVAFDERLGAPDTERDRRRRARRRASAHR